MFTVLFLARVPPCCHRWTVSVDVDVVSDQTGSANGFACVIRVFQARLIAMFVAKKRLGKDNLQ